MSRQHLYYFVIISVKRSDNGFSKAMQTQVIYKIPSLGDKHACVMMSQFY